MYWTCREKQKMSIAESYLIAHNTPKWRFTLYTTWPQSRGSFI